MTTVNVKDLLTGLDAVKVALPARSYVAVLTCVLVRQTETELVLQTTDLTRAAQWTIGTAGFAPCQFAVDWKAFRAAVKTCNPRLLLTLDCVRRKGQWVLELYQDGQLLSRLSTIAAEEFPVLNFKPQLTNVTRIDAGTLAALLRALPYTAKPDDHPTLTQVSWAWQYYCRACGQLHFGKEPCAEDKAGLNAPAKPLVVATDGSRYSMQTVLFAPEHPLVLPETLLKQLKVLKAAGWQVGRYEDQDFPHLLATAPLSSGGTVTLLSEIITEPFPALRLPLPQAKEQPFCRLPVRQVVTAVEALKHVAADYGDVVHYEFRGEQLVLWAGKPDSDQYATRTVWVETPQVAPLALNGRWLAALLQDFLKLDVTYVDVWLLRHMLGSPLVFSNGMTTAAMAGMALKE